MSFAKCKCCGKVLDESAYNLTDYVWKRYGNYFCSYSHMNTYIDERTKPKPKSMNWVKVENKLVAKGFWGQFEITKQEGLFYARYWGKDNTHFKSKGKQTLDEAKEYCEKNYYWERSAEYGL